MVERRLSGEDCLCCADIKKTRPRSFLAEASGSVNLCLGGLFVYRLEFVCADTAERAHPVFGKFFERSSGCYTIVGIAFCGVIDVAAYFAYILLHNVLFLIGLLLLGGYSPLVIENAVELVDNHCWRDVFDAGIVASVTGLLAVDRTRAAGQGHLHCIVNTLIQTEESGVGMRGAPHAHHWGVDE